jgi:hypothetical protein
MASATAIVVTYRIYSWRRLDHWQSIVVRDCVGRIGRYSLAWGSIADSCAMDVVALFASLGGRLEFSRPAILVGTVIFRLAVSRDFMTTNSAMDSDTYSAPLERAPNSARHCGR